MKDCDSDLLLSYIDLVTDSHHDVIVRGALSELTAVAQDSVLKISLLYRFGILMPMTLLKSLIGMTWEQFRAEVVDYDSKNIIIKEETKQFGTEPDVYLRVKHRLIADMFVNAQFGNEDKRFLEYQKLLRVVNPGPSSGRMVVDLLKALRDTNDLSRPKIDRLFDELAGKFQEDPHFAVHYAMNLQRRKTKENLLKGLDVLSYAGWFSESRNDRIIHRKATLNFDLARICYQEQLEPVGGEIRHYMEQAQQFFDLKLILDPCSDFSYTDYLQFLLWRIDKFNLDKSEQHHICVQIEELIEQAQIMVQDGLERVMAERDNYYLLMQKIYGADGGKYVDELNAELKQPDLRPYALILLYHYYKREGDRGRVELVKVIRMLEGEIHLDAVVRLLFWEYGQNLYDVNARQKLLSLDRSHSTAIKKDRLRYHYYHYVAYSYNKEFKYAFEELAEIRKLPFSSNPDLQELWCNPHGEARMFEARQSNSRQDSVFIPDLQKSFRLLGSKSSSETFHVILRFLVSGIVAMVYEGD